MSRFLTEDTKAILLLCGMPGKPEKILTQTEYTQLVCWLMKAELRPSNLLESDNIAAAAKGAMLAKQRLKTLLGRGVQLGFAIEEWQRNGIWIMSRSDKDYPECYKKHLRKQAPPLLFGVGNRDLLKGGGLAIIGSRNVDEEGETFTRRVAGLCAINKTSVISGGARGVDQIAVNESIKQGGFNIAIVADNLLKKSLERDNRNAIANQQLLLLSSFHPQAHFTVGSAMGRNKLIYAMADYALVVSAEAKKGGTWTGAVEELKRENSKRVFIRAEGNVPAGNKQLLELGGIAVQNFTEKNFKQQLQKTAINGSQQQINFSKDEQIAKQNVQYETTLPLDNLLIQESAQKTYRSHRTIFETILPIILERLEQPLNVEELAQELEVNKTQLNVWLKEAVKLKKINKLTKPVRYQKAENASV